MSAWIDTKDKRDREKGDEVRDRRPEKQTLPAETSESSHGEQQLTAEDANRRRRRMRVRGYQTKPTTTINPRGKTT